MKRNGLAIGIIFLIIGTNIIPSTAKNIEKTSETTRGTRWYVGGSGPGNYSKIQDAIDNASEGDTVFVYNDSSPYYENVHVNKSIRLIGEEKSSTWIDAKQNGTVIEINADNVNITNFSIQHSGREDNAGIKLFGNNCNVSSNIISNNNFGICVCYTTDNIIHSNDLRNNNDDNIHLYYTNHSSIQHNIISRVDGYTIGILSVCCNNNTICNNTVNKTYHGIYISASTNSTLVANSVIGCRWKAIILTDAPDNTIKGNFLRQPIYYNYACDITLTDSPRCIVENNTLYSGILIDESYPNIILNNFVQGKPLVYLDEKSDVVIDYTCGQIILINCSNITVKNQNIQQTVRAIYLKDSNHCNLINNTIFNNRQGIICSSSNFTNICNNIITLNKDNGLSIDSSNNNIYNNNIENNEDYGLINSGVNNTIANNNIDHNGYVGFVLTGQNSSIINNTISRNTEGMSIRFLSNTNIKHNIIKQNFEYGISISDSTNNTIAENVFMQNDYGIILGAYCNKHTILNNDFRANQNGLILDDAYNNSIIKNNFIDNKQDAFFQAYLCKAFFNKWLRNYWGQPKFIKIIWGTKTVLIFEHATRTCILFRLDCFPSLKPYNIPLMS
ncbi:hypothetical protein AYK25_02730 [Thermoplasmatales archaeon SM1-50]|nr:MAG: hypothetical protein AYK25_02730 [Thermoplasmatales archaeon SM1-50]